MIDKDKIIKITLDSGFDTAGIAPPVLGDIFEHNFKEWICRGYNGEMLWIEKDAESRTNVVNRYPWARSVLVVGMNYFSFHEGKANIAKISMYSWGKDYHAILYKKLNLVLSRIRGEEKNVIGKICVDSGPILEKAFAVSAGLGCQGKNTVVIVKEFGSFAFLGELILSLPLQPGSVFDDMCGNCTKCIDACPTGALTKPYVLDARRCISYLTIEKKSDLSGLEKSLLNGWLFGCDICQEVCPWNNKWAAQTKDERFYDRISLLERSPREWLELTEHQFGDYFNDSPIGRLKFDHFRRNILVLLQ